MSEWLKVAGGYINTDKIEMLKIREQEARRTRDGVVYPKKWVIVAKTDSGEEYTHKYHNSHEEAINCVAEIIKTTN